MTFFGRILRFLFWLLVLSWSVALLRRLVTWMLQRPQSSAEESVGGEQPGLSRRLVRDPVCGVHVAETLALPLRDHEETLHFCSTQCRDTYLSAAQQKVVNG